MNDLVISPAGIEDLGPLAGFMSNVSGSRVTQEYLEHWYFRNPSRSASVVMGRIHGRIVGMATTNDHIFFGPAGRALVAMPQKVLTDPDYRGKGIFNRLYHAAEAACLDRGVSFFLTITNRASTPIFLGRFGYVRSVSPRIVIRPMSFRSLPPAIENEQPLSEIEIPSNGWQLARDTEHLIWRYRDHPSSDHSHYCFPTRNGPGHLFVKKIRKKGLPVLLVLDNVAPAGQKGYLLELAGGIARRQGCALVLVLDDAGSKGPWGFRINSGFNLLVKGRDVNETRRLAAEKFHLSFGDLDFF